MGDEEHTGTVKGLFKRISGEWPSYSFLYEKVERLEEENKGLTELVDDYQSKLDERDSLIGLQKKAIANLGRAYQAPESRNIFSFKKPKPIALEYKRTATRLIVVYGLSAGDVKEIYSEHGGQGLIRTRAELLNIRRIEGNKEELPFECLTSN